MRNVKQCLHIFFSEECRNSVESQLEMPRERGGVDLVQVKAWINSCPGQINVCVLCTLGNLPRAELWVLWRFEGIVSADLGLIMQRTSSSAGRHGFPCTEAV